MEGTNQKLTTQSNDLDQEIIDSWGGQKDFFIEKNFVIINWEDAKSKLKEGNIEGGKQYHTRWLTIYIKDGQSYLTRQPKLDALWEFMKESNLKIEGFGTE